MTLTLILTRHAKSSWKDPTLDDHARPLNKRGRASAKAIGRWLADHGYTPGEVLCSDAERTRETWALIADKLVGLPDASYDAGLYLTSHEDMLAALRGASAATVMMIAHNPGSATLARRLAAEPHPHQKFQHYPSAATAVIEFDAENWGDVDWGTGRVVEFVVPRELI
ncbi:phosphohistidine phosphatase [Aliiroseovarius halocynthiae]|uniref:Histidine phosphatase family protein n=1 Tax=Aliiroseovarius halocynthiae TaxID=985055 RepID=A0A545SXT5_9RHOB|nr:histidine phosphatase family protein [Aliiroseovarius halocynthiae]TQV69777.1 histidine phosphatase family protein [Aliiroseovarius halocynthiae]SMR81763.1 phosphohistidine phosphatase [Aliiroseovarius halocynthiae]